MYHVYITHFTLHLAQISITCHLLFRILISDGWSFDFFRIYYYGVPRGQTTPYLHTIHFPKAETYVHSPQKLDNKGHICTEMNLTTVASNMI